MCAHIESEIEGKQLTLSQKVAESAMLMYAKEEESEKQVEVEEDFFYVLSAASTHMVHKNIFIHALSKCLYQ